MASHYPRDSIHNKISARLFWYSIYNDGADFVKKYMKGQKQVSLTLKANEQYTCLNCCDESNWCLYLQLT